MLLSGDPEQAPRKRGRTSPRNRQLDALRAIAVLLVLGHHLPFNRLWIRIGWTGVDLFFVLSGFLISGLLFREFKATGDIRITRFLVRRGLKIYPAYYLLIIGTAICYAVFERPLPFRKIATDALFLQSYARGTWGHLWSLAIEEHFYILLPIALWLLMRRGKTEPLRPIPLLCAGVGVVCLAMRSVRMLAGAPYTFYEAFAPSHLRLDSLSFGVLLSYLWEFRPRVIQMLVIWRGRILLFASAAFLWLAYLQTFNDSQNPWICTTGFTCLYLGYGGLMVYALAITKPGSIWVRPLAPLGQYSYTIYLLHVPVKGWVWGAKLDGVAAIMVYFMGAAVLGIIAAKLIEQPVLMFRDRLFPDGTHGRISGRPQPAIVAVAAQ
jgi:peptidoglycan/LPS O-acetylase OafA/YrhL